jgi:Ca2+-binding RTX toxin-like protein
MGRAALLAALLLLTCAAGAQAAGTVTWPGGSQPVTLTDAPGSALALDLPTQGDVRSGFLFRFASNTLQAGTGCRQITDVLIGCDEPEGTPVVIRLDDGPDRLDAQRYAWRLVIDGGPGDDSLMSGTGRDRIDGGEGDDYVDSRDLLFGSRNIGYLRKPVRDMVTCGAGDDSVSVDGSDRVAQDCEHLTIHGTSGKDRLAGDDRGERFMAQGGDDLIIGGRGEDSIAAARGDDRVDARDGDHDSITCGDGRDRVRADLADEVGHDCEKVIRSRGA